MSSASFKHFVLIGSGFATGVGLWLSAGCMSANITNLFIHRLLVFHSICMYMYALAGMPLVTQNLA